MRADATASGSVAPGDRWALRLGWLAVGLGAALAALLALFPILCFDVWWHLRTGALILAEGRIPTRDLFTYTAAGRPWVSHEWLCEVLFHGIDRLGGIDLLVLFKALLAGLALGLGAVAGMIRVPPGRSGGPALSLGRLPAAALGLLLAAPLMAPRAFVRPHMLTALLLGVTLLLLRLESATGERRWRWALVPLFLLWANLHSGFVLGLALVALAWAGEAITRRPPAPERRALWRGRGIVLALALAATLLNPHFVEALLYPLRLVARGEVRSSIVELRTIFHPAYRGALFLKALALSGLVLAALLTVGRRRLDWPLLLPGILFLALALRSLRGVSELSVILPALIAAHGEPLARTRRAARLASGAIALLALAAGAGAVAWGQPMGAEPNRRVGLGIDPTNWPGAAARFLREMRPAGEVFNVLAFGGYLIHDLWPEKRVYIDGRLDVFPAGFIDEYQRMMATGEGWDEAVARYGIEVAVVDYLEQPQFDRGLRARLRQDPDWECVFFSDNALVYARRGGANQELLDRFGTVFDPSLRSWDSVEAFVATASPGQVERAITAVARVADFAPEEKSPPFVLGELLLRAGRKPEAVAALARAIAVDPENFLAHLHLGILCAEARKLDLARHHFGEAERLRPGDPSVARNLELLRSLERSAAAPR